MPLISRREFLDEIDRWMMDCRAQALKLFDAGVEPPRALHIAAQLATELAKRRAERRFADALKSARDAGAALHSILKPS